MIAERDRAAAGLQTRQAVRADLGARRGDRIADRSARHDGIVEGAAFDAAPGADLDIVFEDDAADLRDFVVGAFVGGKSEAIFADGGVGLEDDAVADDAVVIDDGVGIEEAVIANPDAGADEDAGVEDAVVACSLIADGDEGVDLAIVAEYGCGGDVRGGANADFFVFAVAVEGDDDLHEGVVGVFDDQLGGGDVGLNGEDDGASGGGFQLGLVLGIAEEGDIGGPALSRVPAETMTRSRVAVDPAADMFGQFTQRFSLHIVLENLSIRADCNRRLGFRQSVSRCRAAWSDLWTACGSGRAKIPGIRPGCEPASRWADERRIGRAEQDQRANAEGRGQMGDTAVVADEVRYNRAIARIR
jgi:hypothetical protein